MSHVSSINDLRGTYLLSANVDSKTNVLDLSSIPHPVSRDRICLKDANFCCIYYIKIIIHKH